VRCNRFNGKSWQVVEADWDRGEARVVAKGRDSALPTLCPGLVDIHCHGVNGFDVNEGHGAEVVGELRSLGVEWVCPTTVAGPWEELRSAILAVPRDTPGFAGFHLEGPFLNPDRRGAQRAEFLRGPDAEELHRELGELLDAVRIVTLAPELPGAEGVIRYLYHRKIIVSAGHTDATAAILEAASQVGLRHLTHFYNAMRPFHHREPGCVGFGWYSTVACEVIYDRIHVSRSAVDVLFRLKRPEDVIAVSDGTKMSGMAPGAEGRLWGHAVRLERGAVRMEDGSLCGSGVTIVDVFRNLWQDFADGAERAIRACSLNPRRALGLPTPSVWLLVAPDGEILETRAGMLHEPAV
jgi:N-acetylglucosamine-6-phosphate deacetylase